MLDKDINQLIDCYTQVLRQKRLLPPIRNPTVLALDTEFDKEGLISLCLSCSPQSIPPLFKERTNSSTQLIFPEKKTLTIDDFLAIINQFCVNHRLSTNSTIYILCHFAQAELQHIENLWREMRVRVYLKSMYAEYKGKLHLQIVDTFAHFMCGLDKVAKTVGLEKMSLDGVGEKPEKYWKENMRQLLQEHPDVFREYAERDSKVLIEAFLQRRQFFLDNFGIDTLRMVTLAHTAQQVFTSARNKQGNRLFLKEQVEPIIEDEWVNHQARKGSEWQTKWHRAATYAGSRDKRYFAMKCYWGGRREAFIRGFLNEPVEFGMLNKCNPTMARLPLPNQTTEWKSIEGRGTIDEFFKPKTCWLREL
jgi:hypothetical protein